MGALLTSLSVSAEEPSATNPYVQSNNGTELSAEAKTEEIKVEEKDFDKYLSLYELELEKLEDGEEAANMVPLENKTETLAYNIDESIENMSLSIRNELPETITIKMRSAEIGLRSKELVLGSKAKQAEGVYLSPNEKRYHENFFQELYVNPYQTISLQEIRTGRYAVEVFDVTGKLIGYTQKSLEYNEMQNDHLTINRFTLKPKMRQAVNVASPKMLALGKELLSKRKKARAANKKSMPNIIASANSVVKRRIKLANISKTVHHIEIQEPQSTHIGSGWTIPRGLYKPEYLTFQSAPIEITGEADLVFEIRKDGEVTKSYKRKAKELSIDSEGDFILVIEPRQ